MPTIINNVEQGTLEWFQLRMGKVTASELGNLLTPEFKLRTGEMPETYLCEKVAETLLGHALPGFTSYATEQGSIREDEAVPWYELEHDCDVQRVGFVLHDSGVFGCSPDGLIGDDSGLEVKCPTAPVHVKYRMRGELPKQYAAQVHGSMYATGRSSWTFLSYHPNRDLGRLVLTVQRDEAICRKIAEAVEEFSEKFTAAVAALRTTNTHQ